MPSEIDSELELVGLRTVYGEDGISYRAARTRSEIVTSIEAVLSRSKIIRYPIGKLEEREKILTEMAGSLNRMHSPKGWPKINAYTEGDVKHTVLGSLSNREVIESITFCRIPENIYQEILENLPDDSK